MTRPILLQKCEAVRQAVRQAHAAGQTVGIVPTMGALHAGHLSLLRASRSSGNQTLVTIFVNPTQFGPTEDFAEYPRSLDEDLARVADEGATWVFAPSVEEIYPPGDSTTVEPGSVARRWEGEFRPSHFRGVTTVVMKLFQISQPDHAFFGRKDYQQAQVILQMVRDLNVPVRVHVCDTVREPDGLAMSSRNAYLTDTARQQALAIPRAWQAAQNMFQAGERNAQVLKHQVEQTIRQAGIETIDYVGLVHAETLEPVTQAVDETVVLIAARVGTTRLIDNARLAPQDSP